MRLVEDAASRATELLGRTLTFVAAAPPRHSWFAAWDPAQPGGLHDAVDIADDGAERVDVDLLLPAKRGTAPATVSARRIPIASAIDLENGVRNGIIRDKRFVGRIEEDNRVVGFRVVDPLLQSLF